GKCDFEPRADARGRIHGELGPDDARALFDDGWTDPAFVELACGQTSFELEPLAVVFDDQRTGAVRVGQADQHVARATVLPHVDERLLDDSSNFERRGWWKRDWT